MRDRSSRMAELQNKHIYQQNVNRRRWAQMRRQSSTFAQQMQGADGTETDEEVVTQTRHRSHKQETRSHINRHFGDMPEDLLVDGAASHNPQTNRQSSTPVCDLNKGRR